MTWAFVGGVMLDLLLPGARARLDHADARPRRSASPCWSHARRGRRGDRVIAATAFGLSLVYQLLLLVILGVTDRRRLGRHLGATDLALTAVMNVRRRWSPAVAGRARLDLRFGEPERVAW